MKKIKIWEAWDWNSIRSVLVLILIGGSVFFFFEKYPDFVRKEKSETLINISEADFEFVTPIEHLTQSRYSGINISHDYYHVYYNYVIKGIPYSSRDKIPNSVENTVFLEKLKRGETSKFLIRYDPQHPELSQIIIN